METLLQLLLMSVLLSLFASVHMECVDGDIRLNASSPIARTISSRFGVKAGRIEVCARGAWGTVCDDYFTDVNAGVACRQLGYTSRDAAFKRLAYFGQGEGQIVLDNVACTGNETRLVDCANSIHNCQHNEDVGVICQVNNFTCSDGEVRLIGGDTENEGTIQVCFGNRFGTICDVGFNSVAAGVVCSSLGYPRQGAVALTWSTYGEGFGPILMSSVVCNGTEQNISQCRRSDGSSCIRFEDAGVICKPQNASCENGAVRLVGGSVQSEGRLEVCFAGEWGTVCDDNFDNKSADVVCRQLNYTTPGSLAVGQSLYGPGTGPIFIDYIRCFGNESSLLNCRLGEIGLNNCFHFEDISVLCIDSNNGCTNGAVRLRGSPTPNQGRVELCINSRWGTICDNGWNNVAARVVCNQLGYTSATDPVIAVPNSFYGAGIGLIWFGNVRCRGGEATLLQCSHPQPLSSSFSCTRNDNAGVLCPAVGSGRLNCSCQTGDVRLTAGAFRNEGRVEVCVNCVWGTVCDNQWSDQDAQVVCGQLRFSGRALAMGGGVFPVGKGLVFMEALSCIGNETSLFNCSSRVGIGQSSCSHSRDAGVICQAQTQNNSVCVDGAVRLMGTGDDNLGRVEICINNQWGTVCDNQWDNREAQVVCRQLGYNGSFPVGVSNARFGAGGGRIYLSNLNCVGNESSLLDCPRPTTGVVGCIHSNDAGVICATPPCKAGALRLADGTDQYSGRLEVCNGGQWGTVCGKDVSNDLAGTACGLLGFDSKGAVAIGNAVFGSGRSRLAGLVLVQQCTSLATPCTLAVNGTGYQCSHLDDLSLLCTPPASVSINCSTGAVRLLGDQTDGLVEVCLGGQWGTVCDDSWTDSSARVVCKQLGLPSDYAVTVPQSSAKFGSVQVPIALSRVKCTGNESSLFNCQLVSIAAASRHYCTHSNDVGVSCPATTPTSETPFTFESIGTIVDGSALPGAASTSASVAAIVAPIVVMIVLIVVIAVVMVAIVFYMCRGKLTRQFKLQGGTDTVPVMMDKGFTEMDNHPSDPTSAHEGAKAQATSNVDGSYERMPE